MSVPTPGSASSDYRLARPFAARLLGHLVVAVAVVLVVLTVLVVALGLSVLVVLVVAVLGVVGVAGFWLALTRGMPVVHLGERGYRVRLVRGVGVTAAEWKQVGEAATASPEGVPVVVLRLVDGRTTTIPVQVLAADREAFVRDLQARLQRGQRLRPL